MIQIPDHAAKKVAEDYTVVAQLLDNAKNSLMCAQRMLEQSTRTLADMREQFESFKLANDKKAD